ncbi:hypothetical protein HYFRA_00013479 [Hymenoscyphus fraxineus]|uniref:Vps72/YL1 C-terminal domain-containing protein n=1 Tax=Hymenoscyphus fraxineus TaxID=746836 RepID=A0A9N9PYU0_9HELO|nr:hypothetical protein HYFRA_00013479 [Hymenoscyphus fraxineus]
MASENADTPMRSEADDTDTSSRSGSDSDSEQEEAPEPEVEWLATSRAKRSTAGNRLNALIQQEEDDELELLFEEAEDDGVFEDNDADDGDVQMDSSSDEDEGPAAGDDMEGERELQKQAKAEQRKKRKLNDGIPKIYKKKVKIDPTASTAASRALTQAPRPKKKSERASWIPTPEDAPTRASARGTTRESKEKLHQQMIEREIMRQKQLKSMERAAALKKANEMPPMTQEDRLREAAKVEKSNAKSLNRWQEMELQREEEQRLRLAALQNRTLEGPVITWWSGMAEWVGDRLKKAGQTLITEKEIKKEVKGKPSNKRKAAEMEDSSNSTIVVDPPSVASIPESQGPSTGSPPTIVSTPDPKDLIDPQLSAVTIPKPMSTPSNLPIANPPLEPPRHISPILAPPRQPTPPKELTPDPPRVSSVLAPPPMHGPYPLPPDGTPRVSSVLAPPPMHGPIPPPPIPKGISQFSPYPHQHPHQHQATPSQPHFKLAPPIQPHFDGSAPLPGFGYNFLAPQNLVQVPQPVIVPVPAREALPPQVSIPVPVREVTPPPPKMMNTAIEYLILNNFDKDAIKDKNIQCRILFDRTFERIPARKKPELCVINPQKKARYRDPATGLPYSDKNAYTKIQELKRNRFL